MSAWGHSLRRLTEQEVAPGKWGPQTCTAGGRPPCQATQAYVTGRKGRVSWAEKRLCSAHAARTAKRYQLELPAAAAEGPTHASELAVAQLLGEKGGAK